MKRVYTLGEEIFNAISHGIGALLALIGTVILVVLAVSRGRTDEIIAYSIYGTSLFVLYLMSTLYHSIQPARAKRVLQIFDHMSISLLIAGSYTPFALLSLTREGSAGYILLALIWILAGTAMIIDAFWLKKLQKLSLLLYVAMGWVAVLFSKQLAEHLGWQGMTLLAAGGILYTAGIAFYKAKRLKFSHGIWHIFVLGGSIVHYVTILRFT
ncbi:MAG TPA: hemolysin III family protein [bacterium]|nr:hemolysin III family protein [bacterium]